MVGPSCFYFGLLHVRSLILGWCRLRRISVRNTEKLLHGASRACGSERVIHTVCLQDDARFIGSPSRALNGWFTIDSTVTENTVKYMAIVMTRVNIVKKNGRKHPVIFFIPTKCFLQNFKCWDVASFTEWGSLIKISLTAYAFRRDTESFWNSSSHVFLSIVWSIIQTGSFFRCKL